MSDALLALQLAVYGTPPPPAWPPGSAQEPEPGAPVQILLRHGEARSPRSDARGAPVLGWLVLEGMPEAIESEAFQRLEMEL